mgnify:CR=1 FL=1
MDDTKLVSSATGLISDILQAVSNHGFEGLLGLWLLYEKWIVPRKENKEVEKKKASGEYVSWEDVKEVKETVRNHLEDEAVEGERFVKIEGRLTAMEEKLTRENGHLFNQNASLFEKFDKLDAKLDSKFDTITKILLERKA